MFDDDVRDVPAPETKRPVDLDLSDQRMLARLALQLGITEQGVIRLGLQLLDKAPRGRRWA
jgi:hypothetical protein